MPPDDKSLSEWTVSPNLTVNEAGPYVLTHTPPSFQRMMESNYSQGFETDVKKLKENGKDHRKVSSIYSAHMEKMSNDRKWSNPLEVQLPDAPSMKIYCLYGHGKETEVSVKDYVSFWSRLIQGVRGHTGICKESTRKMSLALMQRAIRPT